MKTNLPRRIQRTTRRRGQALVESALVLLFILLPCTVGIMQFGIYLNATNTLNSLAREGGRFAAVGNSDADIIDHIQDAAKGSAIQKVDLSSSTIAITMVDGKTRASGNSIQVTITYPMTKKIFIPSIPGTSFLKFKQPYVASSVFVLE